ncbi:dienelactone hydrolase family protein [Pseudooceanicola sp.]|uniref:dienelactone hydrolase family protein n=1 Tax=Pseudooceanicola sp. TaxID=1914328 RepID=UPI00262BDEF5|nr:dienelactone hydrolase family protein [Pseudooceanicola sp.]MDF1856699.1 dienelactone hydrolase family protein [Pseudooceanicola sp.]
MITTRTHSYSDGTTTYIGYVAESDTAGPRPAVLIAPAFMGLRDFEMEQARRLAELGYTAFAIDFYGDGFRTEARAEAAERMKEVNDNRRLLADRMVCALEEMRGFDGVDPARLAAIGYCLGGKAVLDLARTGADFKIAMPLHGLFDRPDFPTETMKSAVVLLHGWDDPLAKPEAVVAIAEELSEHCPDWDILGFGGTGHGFTNPVSAGYSDKAARRSWRWLTAMLEEYFT